MSEAGRPSPQDDGLGDTGEIDPLSNGVPIAELRLAAGSATHAGLRRSGNEDALLIADPVYLVADGMGGHEAGEIASALAVEAFSALRGSTVRGPRDIRDAFERARRAIARLEHTGSRRAGTTVSGVAVTAGDGRAQWLVFNLGDSRTYRFGRGELEQISVDHSLVQEMLDEGSLDHEAAATHPDRNVITRALGGGGASQPDYWLMPVAHGDRILICSDGVSGELDRAAIARVLREAPTPQEAAERLVHEGILRGGRDNLTAVVIDARNARADAAESDATQDADTIPVTRVTAGTEAGAAHPQH
jgi:protein phosphatase